jgi:hypothetical protein
MKELPEKEELRVFSSLVLGEKNDNLQRPASNSLPMKESGMDLENAIFGEEHIRREKEKARRLRQSAWWMRKIGGGVCHYCRRKVGRTNLTMDHVVPLSRGGRSAKGNIVPACKECNNKKKYLLPIEWKEYLESLSEEFKSDKGL